jgi:hypothetical protein
MEAKWRRNSGAKANQIQVIPRLRHPFTGRKSPVVVDRLGFWWFFNEVPKFMHLDMGKLKIFKKHIADLITMQCGWCQPPPNGIEIDLQDSGGAAMPQTLG